MLLRTIFYCVLLLNICHMHWYDHRYNSLDWRLNSKTNRPFFVGKLRRGVYTIKRGNQTLQSSPTQCLQTMNCTDSTFNLLQCCQCASKQHPSVHCPLRQCTTCHEFGHVACVCKKTLNL